MTGDLILGLDAGTSTLKAVAFDPAGRGVAGAARPNRYRLGPGGAATQDLAETWAEVCGLLRDLAGKIPDLARRTAALAVTAQGDGTVLIDAAGDPVGPAWLWLDSRAAAVAEELRRGAGEAARFAATGTGLAACAQGPQLAFLARHHPELLARAATAFHIKDFLHLRLTGTAATDPCEAAMSFGDFRTRCYDDRVIEAMGLASLRRLLPPILDGTGGWHPLRPDAAAATGLLPGTPVVLGYLDAACTAIGAGVREGGADHGCTILGSTGVHLRACPAEAVVPNPEGTGYVLVLPLPGRVAPMQTNMAGTLNLDWVLGLAREVLADLAPGAGADPLDLLDRWLAAAPAVPGPLYLPYISPAGERGPFVDPHARAGFAGLSRDHGYGDLVRAVAAGLALAARDCHAATGPLPPEIRLTGGAARSGALRALFAAALGRPVRRALRAEAGAAGAAMIAAVAIGAEPDMDGALDRWVTPMLGPPEPPDPGLAAAFDRAYDDFRALRGALRPLWPRLVRGGAPERGD